MSKKKRKKKTHDIRKVNHYRVIGKLTKLSTLNKVTFIEVSKMEKSSINFSRISSRTTNEKKILLSLSNLYTK